MSLAVLLSDTPGLDWVEFYRQQIEQHGWTPRQIAEDITLPQLIAIWSRPEAIPARPSTKPEDQLAMMNRLRARAGKPPLAAAEEGE